MQKEKRDHSSFFIGIIASLIASVIFGGSSILLESLNKIELIYGWGWYLGIFLWILISYFLTIALQYFFPERFVITKAWTVHTVLITLITLIISLPLFLMLNILDGEFAKLNNELGKTRLELKLRNQKSDSLSGRTIQLYSLVTSSMERSFQNDVINSDDINELLLHCVESIKINSGLFTNIRATAVFLNESESYLIMPKRGYYGSGFDRDIERLYFDVSPQKENEDYNTYNRRLGVAGWVWSNREVMIDHNVQEYSQGERHRYKVFDASEKDKADKAMMCIPIFKNEKNGIRKKCIGVLTVSSTAEGRFRESDQKIAEFFAVLLSRAKVPIHTPYWLN